ncbi:MAG: PQQ-dependent sugar dehydrogenase [Bdellovibrionales bacterium]|nr:PQQ-dependent sugar dehydrogenase [Bdellovibrionales bacterium]
MKPMIFFLLMAVFVPNASFGAAGKIEAGKIEATASEVLKFKEVIWGFDFLDEDNALVTLRSGEIHHVNLKTKATRPIAGAPPVVVSGQGGLLDLKLHRSGANTWVYLTASVKPEKGSKEDRDDKQTTGLFRGEWIGNAATGRLQNVKRIFEAEPAVDSSLHFGARIAIQKDGSLYLSLGERNERKRAQDLKQHWGKVLRLKLDGTPFNSAPVIPDALVEVHSYGHRNPQGIGIHPSTGDLFVVEHGPRGGDEINLVKATLNYGWPLVSYGREYWGPSISKEPVKAGVQAPIKYYVPSIAPSSLHFYSGKRYPEFKDHVVMGALAMQHLNIVSLKPENGTYTAQSEVRLFEKLGERIRSVGESPAGEIYFGTDSGRLLRVELQIKP